MREEKFFDSIYLDLDQTHKNKIIKRIHELEQSLDQLTEVKFKGNISHLIQEQHYNPLRNDTPLNHKMIIKDYIQVPRIL